MPYNFDQIIDRRPTESNKWHHYGPDILPMWVADMDFQSPPAVIEALQARVAHGIFGYGYPQPEYFEVIADRLQRLYDWRVDPESIVILPGVIAGFNLACRAVAVPGDGLMLQTPMYPPVQRIPGNIGLTCDEMVLTRLESGRYEIDFDAFEATITSRTRVFVLCNPHNPVGRVFTRDELTRMAELCLKHGLTICADEIHGDLIFSGHTHTPIASMNAEIAARTITLMAPSKTFNLAGLHSSFAVISNEALRERFVAQRLDLVHRMIGILGYTATVAAYRDGQAWLDALLVYLEANRDAVAEFVAAHLPGVKMYKPEGTYLAWLDCRDLPIPGGDPHTFFLEQARVGLNNGATFGKPGEGFVRLNFGCPRALLMQGLERMRDALATL
jgi:cystathionine beta-lyase